MSRRRDDDAGLADTGLDLDQVAGSLARVYAGVTKTDLDHEHPGWAAAARRGLVMFEGDTDDTITVREFAELLCRAYLRALVPDSDTVPFAALPRTVRVGWLAVARHLANVGAFDGEEARKIAQHESRMVSWGEVELAKPES